MKKESIALIGFRGTGKTIMGRILAQKLGWSFVDMDEKLVTSCGMEINQWVTTHGWKSFREAESRLLRELDFQKNLVVATGGGIILSEGNRQYLKEHFFVIWLKASQETIFMRLQQDSKSISQRPPLTEMTLKEEIRSVIEERSILYENVAHWSLETDNSTISDLATKALSHLKYDPRVQKAIGVLV